VLNPEDEYAPECIEQYLRFWDELHAAAEGGTGSLTGRVKSKRDRLSLACLVADLEAAADVLPRRWASTGTVFRLQRRYREWLVLVDGPVDRGHSDLWEAILAMSQALGWGQD
jgi:hypothetical protein